MDTTVWYLTKYIPDLFQSSYPTPIATRGQHSGAKLPNPVAINATPVKQTRRGSAMGKLNSKAVKLSLLGLLVAQ